MYLPRELHSAHATAQYTHILSRQLPVTQGKTRSKGCHTDTIQMHCAERHPSIHPTRLQHDVGSRLRALTQDEGARGKTEHHEPHTEVQSCNRTQVEPQPACIEPSTKHVYNRMHTPEQKQPNACTKQPRNMQNTCTLQHSKQARTSPARKHQVQAAPRQRRHTHADT